MTKSLCLHAQLMRARVGLALRGSCGPIPAHAERTLQQSFDALNELVARLSNESESLDLDPVHWRREPPVLTEVERKVLHLMCRGHKNAEIARLMHYSNGTLKAHVRRILVKLRVENRIQAVVTANRLRLV